MSMSGQSLGLIETVGLAAAIEAADAAIKSANVELLGYESAKGNGLHTVKLVGDVGAVNAAVDAGVAAASRIGEVYAYKVLARTAEGLEAVIIAGQNAAQESKHQETKQHETKQQDAKQADVLLQDAVKETPTAAVEEAKAKAKATADASPKVQPGNASAKSAPAKKAAAKPATSNTTTTKSTAAKAATSSAAATTNSRSKSNRRSASN